MPLGDPYMSGWNAWKRGAKRRTTCTGEARLLWMSGFDDARAAGEHRVGGVKVGKIEPDHQSRWRQRLSRK